MPVSSGLSQPVVQVNVTHLWTAVAAAIVAFSFIFKNAIATMFDSVIFLFVVHAFDVGDGILINGDLHKVSCACLSAPCPPPHASPVRLTPHQLSARHRVVFMCQAALTAQHAWLCSIAGKMYFHTQLLLTCTQRMSITPV